MNGFMFCKRSQILQAVPPLEEKRFRDDVKPGGHLDLSSSCFRQQIPQLLLVDVPVAHDLVGVGHDINVFLYKQDVVDFVLTPNGIRLGFVVNPGEVSKSIQWNLDSNKKCQVLNTRVKRNNSSSSTGATQITGKVPRLHSPAKTSCWGVESENGARLCRSEECSYNIGVSLRKI